MLQCLRDHFQFDEAKDLACVEILTAEALAPLDAFILCTTEGCARRALTSALRRLRHLPSTLPHFLPLSPVTRSLSLSLSRDAGPYPGGPYPIACRSPRLSLDEQTALKAWVVRGGALIVSAFSHWSAHEHYARDTVGWLGIQTVRVLGSSESRLSEPLPSLPMPPPPPPPLTLHDCTA